MTIVAEAHLAVDAALDQVYARANLDVERAWRDLVLLRLRAPLARSRGDEAAYRDFADRYRALATSLGFEGHIAIAEAMPTSPPER